MADERIRFALTANDQTRGAFQSVRSNIEGVAKSLRGITGLGGGIIGAVALGELKQAGVALLDARIAAEKLQNTLTQAVGASGLRSELSFIRDQAQRLGLEFDSTAASYAKFAAAGRGTALEGQQTREIFVGIAQASTALGLSSEETAGALTAVQQIISKGKVSAEELRGQLGERLPGAFQIAARSIGVTTAQLDALLQTGSLTAEEFLPKFARQLQTEFADAAARAADSTQASVNKLTSSWNNLKSVLGEGIAGDAIKAGIDITAGAIENLANSTKRAEQNSKTLLGFLSEIGRFDMSPVMMLARRSIDPQLANLASLQAANESAYSQFQSDTARQFPPRATASSVRAIDNGQMAALNAQATADVRKLLEQYQSPDQKLAGTIADLKRLGALTGTDVSGAISEARRRAAGATVDMAKAYDELDAVIRKAAIDDQLELEAKAANAAADAFRAYVDLLGQVAGNEREGAEKALAPDVAGWQKVADILREIRGTDAASKTRDGALGAANDLLNAGAITFDEYEKLGSKILGLADPAKTQVEQLTGAARQLGLTFTSAFEDAVIGGKEASKVFQALGQDIARIALRKTVTEPLIGALLGTDKSPGLLSGILGIFGGARANGGPIFPGSAYLVGERGPELVVPRSAGTVIPNGALGGAQVINYVTVSGEVSRADVLNAVEAAYARTMGAVVGSMNRNGVLARA